MDVFSSLVFALAGVIVCGVAVRAPRTGVLALCLALPFWFEWKFPIKLGLYDFLIPSIIVGNLLHQTEERTQLKEIPYLVPYLGFLFFSVFAMLSRLEDEPLGKVIWAIYKLVSFNLVYLVVVLNIRSYEDATKAVRLLMIGVFLAALTGISQKYFGNTFNLFAFGTYADDIIKVSTGYGDSSSRVFGTLRSPNEFAGFLLWPLSIAAGIMLSLKSKLFSAKWYLTVFLAQVVALLSTLSRTGWIAFSASFLGLAISFRSIRSIVLIALAVALLFAVNAVVPEIGGSLIKRATTVVTRGSSDDAMTARFERWDFFLKQVENAPLGYGTIPESPFGAAAQPHNTYLYLALVCGVPGLICALVILLGTIKSAYEVFCEVDHVHLKGVFAGIATGTVAFMIHGWFESLWQNWQLGALIWFVAGMTMAVHRMVFPGRIGDNTG